MGPKGGDAYDPVESPKFPQLLRQHVVRGEVRDAKRDMKARLAPSHSYITYSGAGLSAITSMGVISWPPLR